MYRQIWISEEHRGLQRILWKSEATAPIEEFMLNTVLFGLSISPFLTVWCLRQLAYDYEELFSDISNIIL